MYIHIYSIISLRAWEIQGTSGLRGYVAPQKQCYFTHGRHLSHFEATVRSKWLLWSHLEATMCSKWLLWSHSQEPFEPLRGHYALEMVALKALRSHFVLKRLLWSHFEATVRSKWLLCRHFEATMCSKWLLGSHFEATVHSKWLLWSHFEWNPVCACSGCFKATSKPLCIQKNCSKATSPIVWAWYDCFKNCEAATRLM